MDGDETAIVSEKPAAKGKAQTFVEPMTASRFETFVSELFRLQLYRNDDFNLTQSTVLKYLQTSAVSQGGQSIPVNKQKLILDIQSREEDRVTRET